MAVRNLLDSLRSSASLMDDDGEAPYTPPEGPLAGLGIRNWGYNQALNQRGDAMQKFWQNRGKPGAGFLPPSHASPLPSPWEIMGHVSHGRANAVGNVGAKFGMGDYHSNAGHPNTRFDPNQIGVDTGQTLADDQEEFQGALNRSANPSTSLIQNLRRKFGL